MRGRPGTAWLLLLAATPLLVAACHTPPPVSAADEGRRKKACSPRTGAALETDRHAPLPPIETLYPLTGRRVAGVRIEGLRALPVFVAQEALALAPGTSLDGAILDRDVRALLALEVLDEVWADVAPAPDGVVVTYFVTERPLVDRVFVTGTLPPDTGTFFFPMTGDLHVPSAARRAATDLEARLVRLGHLDAIVRTRAHPSGDHRVDLCLSVDAGPVYHVRKVAFSGNRTLSEADLRKAMKQALSEDERESVNVEGGLFRPDVLEAQGLYLAALAYDRGLIELTRAPAVVSRSVEGGDGVVDITFRLQEGPVYRIGNVAFSGDLAAPPEEYAALVDVRPGDVFARSKVLAIIEKAKALHLALGRPSLGVEPRFRTEGDRAFIDLRVGPATEEKAP